ncbi:MAG: LPS biosynthesis glycosyltransferase [Alkalinema sp. CAN_BIN05]|nr:LPS biosynthesis glycosyltransferase [Alkalinema sp. CAN_BIN05]
MNSITLEISSLRQTIDRTFVIAYQEDTTLLESIFHGEQLPYEVLRQVEGEIPSDFSRSYACLMNHCKAWRKIVAAGKAALIIEADFVPVKGFANLPMPCDVMDNRTGVAWLYTCASQLYSVTADGFAEGFSVSTVAYIVTPNGAVGLLALAEKIRLKYGERSYGAWDSEVESFLRSRSLVCYIPFRNYGEHGGIPNPEHAKNRDRWKHFSSCHRADRLYGELAFLPAYALNRWELRQVRLYARMKGLGRLFLGKFLRWKVMRRSSFPLRLLGFAVRRQGL